eukprot:354084-Chlamydomonas_euryale.AAC.4
MRRSGSLNAGAVGACGFSGGASCLRLCVVVRNSWPSRCVEGSWSMRKRGVDRHWHGRQHTRVHRCPGASDAGPGCKKSHVQ